MADPTPYTVSYSFSGFQATSPSSPLPAPPLDAELANIQTALSETQGALKDIRREDGALENGIVTAEALDIELKARFGEDFSSAYDVAVLNGFEGSVEDWLTSLAANVSIGTVTTLPSNQPATVTASGVAPDIVLDFAIPRGVKGEAGDGTGDMHVVDYDPQGKVADVFDTDNHTDGIQNKVFTAAEKTKLAGVEASADVTDAGNVGAAIFGAPAKTTLADNDRFALTDSAASHTLKHIRWSNVLAALQTAFDALFVPLSRTISAGNGLTGGGDFSGDRTVSMGTPSSITRSTSNSVTATSHTHALGFTPAEVYTGGATNNTNFPIGHICAVVHGTPVDRNNAANVTLDATSTSRYTVGGAGSSLAGTWRCRGRDGSLSGSIFQRMA